MKGKSESKLWDIFQSSYPLRNTCFITAFANSIYDLHTIVSEDPDLDVVEVIRERNASNRKTLEGLTRNQIAEVYLFFDFDCHDPKSSKIELHDLINTFSDEHDKGRIFISYPMLESHRHCKKYDASEFLNKTVKRNEIRQYKQLVNDDGHFQQMHKCTKSELDWLIRLHLLKAILISTGAKDPKLSTISISRAEQIDIYNGQNKFYLNIDDSVATLGSFPIFLYYYKGENFLSEINVTVNPLDYPT